MRALLVTGLVWCCSAGMGRTLLELLLGRRSSEKASLSPLDSFVFASAIGLGIVAYCVFAAGLCGLFTSAAFLTILLIAGAVGLRGMRATWADARTAASGLMQRFGATEARSARHLTIYACWCLLLLLAIVAVAACLQPPGAHAWDSLAYHLADPKVYLQQRRIAILPTEHHSNFPFTMEMLFAIGLAFDGYAAANLFHLVMFVLLVLAIVSACTRYLSYGTGMIAAVLLASTPIVLWEATVAYSDLGLSLYIFLAWYALTIAVRARECARVHPEQSSLRASDSRLLLIGGAMLGLALGIKYLALLSLGFLVLLALVRRVPVRQIALFALTAILVGSPWYIKNIVWMHNPVYPFAYRVFPRSLYWTEDRATPYSTEQQSFGTEHSLAHPALTLRNLIASPWSLIANPQLYTNQADFTFTSLIGGLYAGFLFSLAFIRRKPPLVWDSAIVFGLLFVSWFFISEHIRYLLPALPFAAIVAAFAARSWLEAILPAKPSGPDKAIRSNVVNIVPSFLTVSALVGQVVLLGWGITALPVSGRADPETPMFTALSAPEAFADLLRPAERERHVRRLTSYGAAEWLNSAAPLKGGVILYEDVHGFYIDRSYLWGNGEHSAYIPYDKLKTGHDLTVWMRQNGYVYALFNLNYAPRPTAWTEANPSGQLPEDPDEVNAIMRQWYFGSEERWSKLEGWRKLVGEAINSGEWVVRYSHHGVAVLEIGAGKP